MKSLTALLLATAACLAPAAGRAASPGYLRASYLEGEVQVKTPEAGEWGLLSLNAPLTEGDQLWVSEGARAELQLNGGTRLRLDESSALHVLSVDEDASHFYLSQGRSYVSFDGPEGSVLHFDTPEVSTRAEGRTTFRVDLLEGATEVSVYKGYVETENEDGEGRVNAGEMLGVTKTSGTITALGAPDEWTRWNRARNERVATATEGVGTRYLPPELRPFAPDLDENGRWVTVSEFGTVWAPSAGRRSGWAPYREGRWVWRGGEYIWVAHEPWGWAPYHYGRWAFVPAHGWCWVPPRRGEVYWSPGYVGWVRTPQYVAWVPLAPGETYYGRGYHGPHSVNVTQVNVTHVHVTHVYRNVQVNNGATVVPRQSFGRGAPTVVHVKKDVLLQRIFTRRNIDVRGPGVKPERGALLHAPTSVAPARQPPESVRRVEVKDLKGLRRVLGQRPAPTGGTAPGAASTAPAAPSPPVAEPVRSGARPDRPEREDRSMEAGSGHDSRGPRGWGRAGRGESDDDSTGGRAPGAEEAKGRVLQERGARPDGRPERVLPGAVPGAPGGKPEAPERGALASPPPRGRGEAPERAGGRVEAVPAAPEAGEEHRSRRGFGLRRLLEPRPPEPAKTGATGQPAVGAGGPGRRPEAVERAAPRPGAAEVRHDGGEEPRGRKGSGAALPPKETKVEPEGSPARDDAPARGARNGPRREKPEQEKGEKRTGNDGPSRRER